MVKKLASRLRRLPYSLFANMGQSLREKRCHMVIVQRIVHDLTLFTIFDQFGLSKRPQLVGNSGFDHSQQGRNIADAHFAVDEGADYPYAGGIAEYAGNP